MSIPSFVGSRAGQNDKNNMSVNPTTWFLLNSRFDLDRHYDSASPLIHIFAVLEKSWVDGRTPAKGISASKNSQLNWKEVAHEVSRKRDGGERMRITISILLLNITNTQLTQCWLQLFCGKLYSV